MGEEKVWYEGIKGVWKMGEEKNGKDSYILQ